MWTLKLEGCGPVLEYYNSKGERKPGSGIDLSKIQGHFSTGTKKSIFKGYDHHFHFTTEKYYKTKKKVWHFAANKRNVYTQSSIEAMVAVVRSNSGIIKLVEEMEMARQMYSGYTKMPENTFQNQREIMAKTIVDIALSGQRNKKMRLKKEMKFLLENKKFDSNTKFMRFSENQLIIFDALKYCLVGEHHKFTERTKVEKKKYVGKTVIAPNKSMNQW